MVFSYYRLRDTLSSAQNFYILFGYKLNAPLPDARAKGASNRRREQAPHRCRTRPATEFGENPRGANIALRPTALARVNMTARGNKLRLRARKLSLK